MSGSASTPEGPRWDPLYSRFRSSTSESAPANLCLMKLQRFGGASLELQDLLTVHVRAQRMDWWKREISANPTHPGSWQPHKSLRISTSKLGIGPLKNSNRTPLGLHYVAKKIGAGHPVGSVFRGRRLRGFTWDGMPDAGITTRILWLRGREPGRNLGGDVDTFERYVYIHGFSDETTLGLPHSCGCVHVEARELIPLFDRLPIHTPVWIQEN